MTYVIRINTTQVTTPGVGNLQPALQFRPAHRPTPAITKKYFNNLLFSQSRTVLPYRLTVRCCRTVLPYPVTVPSYRTVLPYHLTVRCCRTVLPFSMLVFVFIFKCSFFPDVLVTGGKQWQTTPKILPRMQCVGAIPVAWLGSGSCQTAPRAEYPLIN
jgi:hypothetical protein